MTSSTSTADGTRLSSARPRESSRASIVSFRLSTYSRGALVLRRPRQRLSRPTPTVARCSPLSSCATDTVRIRASRDQLGQLDAVVGVLHQERKRTPPDRFGKRLGAQVGGADRVCLVDHVRAPVLVPANSERQAEGENQSHHPQQRRLQHSKRLAQTVRPVPVTPAQPHPDGRRAEHDRKQEQTELEAGQSKERHPRTLVPNQPAANQGRIRGVLSEHVDGPDRPP